MGTKAVCHHSLSCRLFFILVKGFLKSPEATMAATVDQDTQHSGGSGKHSVDYSDIEDSDIDSDSD